MKIAVLMSAYNGEKYIKEQIESIFGQKVNADLDLIVRDDGSSDNTRAILQSYMDKGQLRWYSGENLKPAKSFLDLVQNCFGYDYYAFADQDDVWYPDKLQHGIDAIEHLQCPAMSFANARLVDAQLQPMGRNVHRNAPNVDFYSVTCGAGVMGCTVVFNDALAELIQAAPMPRNLIMHDSYLAIVCALHDGVIMYDHAPCMDYRQHGKNVVGSSGKKIDALKNRIRRLTVKAPVTLDMMAESICANYPTAPNQEKLNWLRDVSHYRDSLYKSAKLALDQRPTYNSRNMEFTLRLSIFLRNR